MIISSYYILTVNFLFFWALCYVTYFYGKQYINECNCEGIYWYWGGHFQWCFVCTSFFKQSSFHLSDYLWWSEEDCGIHLGDYVINRYLESREIIATQMVDNASWLYTFTIFLFDNVFYPSVIDHTSSVDHDFEENFGYLNLRVLTCDLDIEPCISSPPPTIAIDDACIAKVMNTCI